VSFDKNGKHGTSESHARNDGCLPSKPEGVVAKLDTHHARTIACLGKTEATDMEANPEDLKSKAEDRNVPKKEPL
jgi:hypothetical protein